MCGICGFVGPASGETLERMSILLRHRGPDDSGTWMSAVPPVHLASRRLAVVDLAGGHQPIMTDDAQFVIVFNGEIYNHRELRAELQDRRHENGIAARASKIFCPWLHSCALVHFGWSSQTSGRLFASSRCPVAGLSRGKILGPGA